MIAVVTPINRPAEIQQRASGIARINSSVGLLDDIAYFASPFVGSRRLRALSPPDRQGLVEAEGVSDRERCLAHF